jgi:Zn-dependent alcohol dehydrogenase
MQQKADGVRAIVTIDHAEGTVRAASRTCKPVALTVATINALNDVFPNGAILDAESCGGTLVIFDILGIGNGELSGHCCELRLRNLETIARGNKWLMDELVERLVRWNLHPEDLVTHRFELDRVGDAYALMASGECGKVAVCFDEELKGNSRR